MLIGPLFKNGASQKQAVGTFNVCLAWPKVCPTDIVRPHSVHLIIDTSVNQLCKMWPSADWPLVSLFADVAVAVLGCLMLNQSSETLEQIGTLYEKG